MCDPHEFSVVLLFMSVGIGFKVSLVPYHQ
ncbi:hypothetical protein LINPERHAP1_LOCUS27340 [Linum perenne]